MCWGRAGGGDRGEEWVAEKIGNSPRFALAVVALSLLGGAAFPVQGRLNSELAAESGDPVFASLVSFLTGLSVMVLAVFATPHGRRAWSRVAPALRSGQVRWWYLLAGGIGVALVFGQTLTIGITGIAVFSVAVIAGQVLGGVLWDQLGLTPAGKKRLTRNRGVAALLTLVALGLIILPHLTTQLAEGGLSWLWTTAALIPLVGGIAGSGQQVINGRQSAAYRSAFPGTLFNYAAGTVLLCLIYGCLLLIRDGTPSISPVWWHYLGGPLGCLFIGISALLIARAGALAAGLGVTAGQLVASLVLDLWWPAPGSAVTWFTVVGVGLAFAAVALVVSSGAKREPGQLVRDST